MDLFYICIFSFNMWCVFVCIFEFILIFFYILGFCVDLLQEIGSLVKSGQVVDLFVVDLGFLEIEFMSIDLIEVLVLEFVISGGDYKLNFDYVSFGYGEDFEELFFKKLKIDFGQFEFGYRKLEIEEKEGRVVVEDVKGGFYIMD